MNTEDKKIDLKKEITYHVINAFSLMVDGEQVKYEKGEPFKDFSKIDSKMVSHLIATHKIRGTQFENLSEEQLVGKTHMELKNNLRNLGGLKEIQRNLIIKDLEPMVKMLFIIEKPIDASKEVELQAAKGDYEILQSKYSKLEQEKKGLEAIVKDERDKYQILKTEKGQIEKQLKEIKKTSKE